MKHFGAIDAAFAEAERAVTQSHALVRVKAAEAAALPIASPGGVVNDSAGQRLPAEAAEALQHFRGWVFCAVRTIAQRIAGLPIAVERRTTAPRGQKAGTSGGAGDWQPVEPTHPLVKLFDDPCPIMPRPSLMFSYVASLELTGRGLMLIDDAEGLALWPIPTSWATPQHLPGKPFDSWKLQSPNSTETMEIVADDMIYSAYPDPSNPLGSVSPLEAAGLAVLADEKLQTSQLAAFDNNCLPGVAVIVGDVQRTGLPDARPVLKRQQREQIIRSVRLMHTGAWRAREPWILDGFVRDVKPITTAPAEMDFKDSGDVLKRRILAAFGVSPKHRRDAATDERSVAQAGTWELFRQRSESNHLDSNPDLWLSTAKLYRQSLDVFQRLCSPRLLSEVTTGTVADFRALLVKQKTGTETIKRHLRALRVAINKAWEWELIERLPRFPSLGSASNDPVVIPDEHFAKLYAACKLAQYPSANNQPYTAADWWRGALVLMLFTGLRRCEWLNLPWADVSLDRGELVICKARNKSKRDDRIPLHPVAVAHLRKLSDYGPLVFPFQRFWAGCNRDLAMNALYGEWKRIQKAAGLENRYRFHDFRDTALTRLACIMAPAQLHMFSRHSDFATTDKHYLGRGAMLSDGLGRVPVPDCLAIPAGAVS